MNVNQKTKTKIRNSSAWRKFRAEMYKRSNGRDAITGGKLRKGWQLHHLDLDIKNYAKINDPSHFVCLNKKTHDMLHFVYNTISPFNTLNNFREIVFDMYELNRREFKNE